MGTSKNLIGAALAGAGAMYLFDPARGRRRRAGVRDQLTRKRHQLDDATDTAGRDLKNRVAGAIAETRGRLLPDHAGGEVVRERVRTELGRLVSHPHAIHVSMMDGTAILSGPILKAESDRLVEGVRSVRGVHGVEDRLERHDRPEGISGLQGGRFRRRGRRPELLQENWAPAARFVAGLTGGALIVEGRRRGGAVGLALSAAGAGMALRAVTNMAVNRLTGVNAGRRAIDINKNINVNAPVDEVFGFWDSFENFPRFMQHLREVRETGGNRSHWIAEGPAGTTVAWDAVVTEREPNRLIAWRSVPGSPLGTAGRVRFQPNAQGGTRVDIHLHYNPPGGAIGHAIASLLGAAPKRAMDEDLVRFKSLVESGKTSAKGEEVYRDRLEDVPEPRPRRAG